MTRKYIVLCGPGQSGKDLAAQILNEHSPYTFAGSTSRHLADHVENEFRRIKGKEYPSTDACYADRYNHREFWAGVIDRYNHADPLRMYREMMQYQTIIQRACRTKEIQALRSCGESMLFVWIRREGVPADPTQEFGSRWCDVVIENPLPYGLEPIGALVAFEDKLLRVSQALG